MWRRPFGRGVPWPPDETRTACLPSPRGTRSPHRLVPRSGRRAPVCGREEAGVPDEQRWPELKDINEWSRGRLSRNGLQVLASALQGRPGDVRERNTGHRPQPARTSISSGWRSEPRKNGGSAQAPIRIVPLPTVSAPDTHPRRPVRGIPWKEGVSVPMTTGTRFVGGLYRGE
jgi:hypothetical protein